MNKKEVNEFICYMLQYLDYGRIDYDPSWNEWYVFTPKSYHKIVRSNKGYIIFRQMDNGRFSKQETTELLTYALFKSYFRDYIKGKEIKLNPKTFASFYQQFNSYLILKAIERLEID